MGMTKQAYFTKIRRYRIKKKAVELKGGKCQWCGWSGDIGGFCFHHRDPSQKEFGLSNAITTNWEKFWKEVEKCDLLCCNCHMVFHSDYSGEQFLKDVEEYGGRELEVSDIHWKNQTQIPKQFEKVCEFCKNKFTTRIEKEKFCSQECWHNQSRKCERPSKEELLVLIETMSFVAVGKKFGVSDNSIRKWCKNYKINF